ncbi:MAG: hypothetical protein HC896_06275 [Bacteroidales bacterium]|nr:hypothetical protein [Bacteroidales bacterium]
MLKAVWGYMGDKLAIPVAELSKENIVVRLKERGVNEALINDYAILSGLVEGARYAPSISGATMPDVYKKCIEVLTKIEQEIR